MKLVRPRQGRMIAGVCVGLAERFDVPVWLVRFLFLLFIPLPPSALLIYLVLWVLIPNEGSYRAQ